MFRFLHSWFDRDDGLEAIPLLPEEDPELSTPAGRMVDVHGLIVQASSRVPVGRLRKLGKTMVSLLSRRKIDELVTQAIRRFVERSGPDASPERLPEGAAREIRKEFDELLAQVLGSALDGDTAPENRAFEVIEGRGRPGMTLDRLELDPGRGLHVETRSVSAVGRMKGTGERVMAGQDNAFLKVLADASTRSILRQLDLGWVAHRDSGYIVGDPATQLGKIFGQVPRRPMKEGVLSPDEPAALFILSLLLRQVIGSPVKPGELCVYAVPADPLEGDRNFIYHQGAIESALKALGYAPRPMTESQVLVSSELKDQDYTGIGVSCGAGMTTIGIAYKGLSMLGFSMSRGGDWIDQRVAESLGIPPEEAGRIRASGMDLRSPKGRTEGAIAIFTRTFLQSITESLKAKLVEAQALPHFGRPVPVVCAGTAVEGAGFLELFKAEIEQARLPIRIDYLRLARDPRTAVAEGCLEAAQEETRSQGEFQEEAAPAALARAEVSGVPQRGLPSLSQLRASRAS
ncbi:MAG TPA: cell division protein FtsA [Planctomycetota bacterium]|nr:cell division protein FtsA [Planctomycetota bacterium]